MTDDLRLPTSILGHLDRRSPMMISDGKIGRRAARLRHVGSNRLTRSQRARSARFGLKRLIARKGALRRHFSSGARTESPIGGHRGNRGQKTWRTFEMSINSTAYVLKPRLGGLTPLTVSIGAGGLTSASIGQRRRFDRHYGQLEEPSRAAGSMCSTKDFRACVSRCVFSHRAAPVTRAPDPPAKPIFYSGPKKNTLGPHPKRGQNVGNCRRFST